jgi:hypothetical protein
MASGNKFKDSLERILVIDSNMGGGEEAKELESGMKIFFEELGRSVPIRYGCDVTDIITRDLVKIEKPYNGKVIVVSPRDMKEPGDGITSVYEELRREEITTVIVGDPDRIKSGKRKREVLSKRNAFIGDDNPDGQPARLVIADSYLSVGAQVWDQILNPSIPNVFMCGFASRDSGGEGLSESVKRQMFFMLSKEGGVKGVNLYFTDRDLDSLVHHPGFDEHLAKKFAEINGVDRVLIGGTVKDESGMLTDLVELPAVVDLLRRMSNPGALIAIVSDETINEDYLLRTLPQDCRRTVSGFDLGSRMSLQVTDDMGRKLRAYTSAEQDLAIKTFVIDYAAMRMAAVELLGKEMPAPKVAEIEMPVVFRPEAQLLPPPNPEVCPSLPKIGTETRSAAKRPSQPVPKVADSGHVGPADPYFDEDEVTREIALPESMRVAEEPEKPAAVAKTEERAKAVPAPFQALAEELTLDKIVQLDLSGGAGIRKEQMNIYRNLIARYGSADRDALRNAVKPVLSLDTTSGDAELLELSQQDLYFKLISVIADEKTAQVPIEMLQPLIGKYLPQLIRTEGADYASVDDVVRFALKHYAAGGEMLLRDGLDIIRLKGGSNKKDLLKIMAGLNDEYVRLMQGEKKDWDSERSSSVLGKLHYVIALAPMDEERRNDYFTSLVEGCGSGKQYSWMSVAEVADRKIDDYRQQDAAKKAAEDAAKDAEDAAKLAEEAKKLAEEAARNEAENAAALKAAEDAERKAAEEEAAKKAAEDSAKAALPAVTDHVSELSAVVEGGEHDAVAASLPHGVAPHEAGRSRIGYLFEGYSSDGDTDSSEDAAARLPESEASPAVVAAVESDVPAPESAVMVGESELEAVVAESHEVVPVATPPSHAHAAESKPEVSVAVSVFAVAPQAVPPQDVVYELDAPKARPGYEPEPDAGRVAVSFLEGSESAAAGLLDAHTPAPEVPADEQVAAPVVEEQSVILSPSLIIEAESLKGAYDKHDEGKGYVPGGLDTMVDDKSKDPAVPSPAAKSAVDARIDQLMRDSEAAEAAAGAAVDASVAQKAADDAAAKPDAEPAKPVIDDVVKTADTAAAKDGGSKDDAKYAPGKVAEKKETAKAEKQKSPRNALKAAILLFVGAVAGGIGGYIATRSVDRAAIDSNYEQRADRELAGYKNIPVSARPGLRERYAPGFNETDGDLAGLRGHARLMDECYALGGRDACNSGNTGDISDLVASLRGRRPAVASSATGPVYPTAPVAPSPVTQPVAPAPVAPAPVTPPVASSAPATAPVAPSHAAPVAPSTAPADPAALYTPVARHGRGRRHVDAPGYAAPLPRGVEYAPVITPGNIGETVSGE